MIQIQVANGRASRVRVTSGFIAGVVVLNGRAVTHAEFGSLFGADALFAMIATRDAAFSVEEGMGSYPRTIYSSFAELLREARRLEESGAIPSPNAAHSARRPEDYDDNSPTRIVPLATVLAMEAAAQSLAPAVLVPREAPRAPSKKRRGALLFATAALSLAAAYWAYPLVTSAGVISAASIQHAPAPPVPARDRDAGASIGAR